MDPEFWPLTRIRRRMVIEHEVVESGSFVIGPRSAKTLEAYLGSCVGVALFDPQAEIGGILHLLLPEPPQIHDGARPDRYASLGLPRFLEALTKLGAEPDKLQAWVAGGAFVGRVTEVDTALDIGGRTTEIVNSFLEQQGITVREAETGGYFSCRLSLDLSTFNCRIEPVGSAQETGFIPPQKTTLAQVEKAIRQVRPVPQIALKIFRLLSRDDFDFSEVADLVRRDQVISAKILQIANSPIYNPTTTIESIDRAVLTMGQLGVLQLVASASMERFFPPNERGYSLTKGGLYYHAVGTAIISAKLAELTGLVKPGVAYTAGLVHDIGKVVLDQKVASSQPLFYRRMLHENRSLLEAEEEIIGLSHTEAGRMAAVIWSLPPNLTEVIHYHHTPELSQLQPELAHLVYLANLIMSRFRVSCELERIGTGRLEKRMAKIGLTPEDLPSLVDFVPSDLFSA